MIRGFFSALAFLTIVPIPEKLKSRRESGMFAGYPPAGLAIGAFLSAFLFAAQLLFPLPLAVALLLAVSLFVTGAIHLDGLADCADAFYGRRDRETILRILKDPRIGTMGGVAIGLSLLVRYSALVSLPPRIICLALPLCTMLARTAVIIALRVLPYVRATEGTLAATTRASPLLVAGGIVAAALAAALLPIPTAAALVALAVFWLVSRKKIGGCTGDVLGATIEIAEISFLAALAAAVKTGTLWGALQALFPAR